MYELVSSILSNIEGAGRGAPLQVSRYGVV
jgi:hypothetical protein